MIAIIDSGGANIASVQFALERLGAESVLTKDVKNNSICRQSFASGGWCRTDRHAKPG
jgi:imidazoleglycerol phosphate synthase glutamine amidotransferase subunit HisH